MEQQLLTKLAALLECGASLTLRKDERQGYWACIENSHDGPYRPGYQSHTAEQALMDCIQDEYAFKVPA